MSSKTQYIDYKKENICDNLKYIIINNNNFNNNVRINIWKLKIKKQEVDMT